MTPILVQFVFRLTFGMALSMAATPSSLVTSGFYRVHMWVLMGLNTFAALALYSTAGDLPGRGALAVAVGIAVVSYLGAAAWLYESRRVGVASLTLVSAGGLAGALLATQWARSAAWMLVGEVVSSGLMMGAVTTSMLLGHWYLNTPTMKLMPLERLIRWSMGAALLRVALCALGIALLLAGPGASGASLFWVFVAFRWGAGLIAVTVLIHLARQTLRVPNTQSATGILYAAVILVLLGELLGQLVSSDAAYPL